MEPVGKWGLCQWFEEHGTAMVHSDDLDALRSFRPNGRVFNCIDEDESFLVLRYGEVVFRVKPALFKAVPAPKWQIGETVEVVDRGRMGQVAEIRWHFQRAEPMYFLSFDGKISKKRYWSQDLTRCPVRTVRSSLGQ